MEWWVSTAPNYLPFNDNINANVETSSNVECVKLVLSPQIGSYMNGEDFFCLSFVPLLVATLKILNN